jgi:hypothetical protein
MKGFRWLALIGVICLAAICVFAPVANAENYPGANYVGDCDNGLIDLRIFLPWIRSWEALTRAAC